MDLKLAGKRIIVCGATSGFGLAVTECLAREGTQIIAVARNKANLDKLTSEYPGHITPLAGDITQSETIAQLKKLIAGQTLYGVLVNAGGPPATSYLETTLEQWDDAYQQLIRWKVELTNMVLPILLEQGFGRILYVESMSVKQPIENLCLSNSLRMAVVGFVKTLALEIADSGVTCNVLAPGSHATPAMKRIFKKKSESMNITELQAAQMMQEQIPVKEMGNPDDFAALATWLFSPYSCYMTGQTISVDGGAIKHSMG